MSLRPSGSACPGGMAGMLSNAFGKGPKNYGDVEFWHTPERAGWLMKQGALRCAALQHCIDTLTPPRLRHGPARASVFMG